MDIERLTKSQIVLLTLLVSFVTSIATGIVTVSLMNEAPAVIPQTVNRVVERTVERVVPAESQPATVITQEKTVVVQESELIAQAVQRIGPSVVRVHIAAASNPETGGAADSAAAESTAASATTTERTLGEFVARGLVIAPDTVLVGAALSQETDYRLATRAGERPVRVVGVSDKRALTLLTLPDAEATLDVPAASMSSNALTLGQSVIAVTGTAGARVAGGIVSSINEDADTEGNAKQGTFEAEINEDALVLGAVITNTDGAVVGMYTGDVTNIVPTRLLLETLDALQKEEQAQRSATSTAAKTDNNG